MSSSDNSSDDGAYTNPSSKLHNLNRQAKRKALSDEEDDDEDDDSDVSAVSPTRIIPEEDEDPSIFNSPGHKGGRVEVGDEEEKEEDTEQEEEESDDDLICTNLGQVRRGIVNGQVIGSPSSRGMPRTSTRNTISAGPSNIISLDDSIDRELDKTYDDSFSFSQEDENIVCIGSPGSPSAKKSRDDFEVSVKVRWMAQDVVPFKVRESETLQKIFLHFAKLADVSEEQIRITKNEKRIGPFDTPSSINYQVIDILDGGIISAEFKRNKGPPSSDNAEVGGCKIKIQTTDKKSLVITLKHEEKFSVLLNQCSEQLGIPKSKIKFFFDGEEVDITDTPDSLDLDDEACFDLKLLK
ncbi:hypothetical protein QAD02_004418 [Eretmocerus hayati]|uniref:Uncharacterized protein n=1 Tax=Eretmocerus hayati TaxID=131215 RepID=A0ACC2NQJ6_9HYME|nr:hypothetical protein QAD02_004418 [Eretmocerus hayati]